jgi:hypothetical protein
MDLRLSTLLLVFLVCGCTTTLTHERLIVGAQPSEPGFSYYLPRQRFTVIATYELRSCPNAGGGALTVSQTAAILETPIADPAEFYSIPLKTLTSGWKTTSLTGSVYENQTLHTFGVTVEDRSGAVVKGALGTALSIARIGGGIPAAEAALPLCHPEVYKALDRLREGQSKLSDPALDEAARAGWVAAISTSKAALQITQTYIFDPTPESFELQGNPDSAKLFGWFANPTLISNASDSDRASYQRALTTVIRIRDKPVAPFPVPTGLAGQGIIYREPAAVVTQVCAGPCNDADPQVLVNLETQVAQFGRYAVIPLTNGVFEKNNIALSFAANGRLDSLTYGTESRFEKIASSILDSATSIEGYLAQKKAADQAAAQVAAGAELQTLKAETELLNAKADKIEAETRLLNMGAAK